MKDAGWWACCGPVVYLLIMHGNVTSQPLWRMGSQWVCPKHIMWTRSGCASKPLVTAWATHTLTSVHLSFVNIKYWSWGVHILHQISSCFALLTHLASVCVMVQTGSKCSLWRTKCAGYLEAGTGSVLVRLSDRYPGKAHLNPRCSGENNRYRCTGEMHATGRNPSVLMSGITLFYSEDMNAHVQQNKYSGTSF